MTTQTLYITDPYGVPKPGVVSPTLRFVKYATRANEDLLAQAPAIIDVGFGSYVFTPTDSQELQGIVFLIETGDTPAYFAGTIGKPEDPFEAFVLTEEATANLWTGSDPVFGEYADFTGAARTPPTITSHGSGLFSFTPPLDNRPTGDVWRIDCPVGSFPPFLYGSSGPMVEEAKLVHAVVPVILDPLFEAPTAKPLARKPLMDSGEV